MSILRLVAPSQRPQGKGKAKIDKDNIEMTDINIKGKKAKPIKPNLYYRERNKLNSWLFQFEFYFSFVNKSIKDKEKVIFAVSYMRGRALNWISTDIIRYIDDDDLDDNIKE